MIYGYIVNFPKTQQLELTNIYYLSVCAEQEPRLRGLPLVQCHKRLQ